MGFGVVFAIAGLFTLVCTIGDFDWFMNHHKSRFWVGLIGRPATRGLYIVLGILLTGLGVASALGLVNLN